MRKAHYLSLTLSLVSSLLIAGCTGAESDPVEEGDVALAADDAEGKADLPSIAFTEVDDPAASSTSVVRKLFTSQQSYVAFFGHKAPPSVDFSREWVIFYSAGVKNTGGYTASIASIKKSGSGLTLKVTTSLKSPGASCFVTEALTQPHVLVKLKKQSVSFIRYYRDDITRDCNTDPCAGVTCPTGSFCNEGQCLSQCATVRCAAGTHCEVVGNAVSCVADAPTGPFCGGIAGIRCPGAGKCVDNPNDGCDPNKGGADCGGVCTCIETQLCIQGSHFNSDPTVCACVPDVQDAIPCGPNTCGKGQYCCNASCGICAPIGAACIQQFCN